MTDLLQALRRLDSYSENNGFIREVKKVEKCNRATEVNFVKGLASSNSVKGTGQALATQITRKEMSNRSDTSKFPIIL